MRIFVDFDDVLFHTGVFREDFRKLCEKYGIAKETFIKSYAVIKKNDEEFATYDFERHVALLKKTLSFDEEALREAIRKFLVRTQKYIFPDTKDFFAHLSLTGHGVYIISHGTSWFQHDKVKGARVAQFVKKAVVSAENKEQEIQTIFLDEKEKEQKGVFIDDRARFIHSVKKKFPEMITIFMQRPEGRYKGENCTSDYRAKNLSEVWEIIKSLQER